MVNAIIADDNKDFCMALANELNVTKELKVVEMINDGTRVIQEIKKLKPEIIVLDLKMPGKNGLQIIDEIERDDSITTKVIVLSGESSYMEKVRTTSCIVDYIMKSNGFKKATMEIQKVAKDIGKKNIKQVVLEYLIDLGFSKSKQGTIFLRDCICIYLIRRQDDCKVKELFKIVADNNDTVSYRVKNNIHKATKFTWDMGNREYIVNKLKLAADEDMSPKKVITMSQYYIDID